MRILINGLPLFSKRLADDLKKIDPSSTFTFVDTYNSKLEQVKFLLLLPFCDAVISMNGVTDQSGSLDWVLRMKKKLIIQWQGTDVMLALERMKNKTINRKYIDYAVNFVDAIWLKEEIESIGVHVEMLKFKYISPGKPVSKYEKVSVMSYISQSRQAFYGMQSIVEAAAHFPEIDFNIFGMSECDFSCTPNVHLHGWRSENDFAKALQENAIFLRLTEHDGFSVSVIEALGYGCEVIWTYPETHVVYLKEKSDLIKELTLLIEKVEKRGLCPNFEASNEVALIFNRETVMSNYHRRIKKIVG